MSADPQLYEPLFRKPKILLLDCDPNIGEALREIGLNVKEGSLGKPYAVAQSPNFLPIEGSFSFPNASEQEIVVTDLTTREPLPDSEGEPLWPNSEVGWWAKCSRGVIDPRPLGASLVSSQFDRIFKHGAVFVVFASPCVRSEFRLGSVDNLDRLNLRDEIRASAWDFLLVFQSLEMTQVFGEETVVDESSKLGRLLAGFLSGSGYECAFPRPVRLPLVSTIAFNKHNEVVSFETGFGKPGDGRIIVVPQLADKVGFIRRLITDFLPSHCPEFFPEFGSRGWVHEIHYELPRVLELSHQRQLVRDEFEQRVKDIEDQIEAEKQQNGWMYQLLTETGESLVSAVKEALKGLGFSDVKDVDAERDAIGQSRREDLQILDASPIIIVDIKGVGGIPSDSDIQQAGKHATIRMREWKSTEVISLFVVNQERNMPPLKRSEDPFRREMVAHSEDVHTGLITTWDLYRLVRGQWQHGWSPDHVKPLFYKSGRILPVPIHYKLLGTVMEVLKPAFVLIAEGDLKTGDRLAWNDGTGFCEQSIVSLQVNGQSVNSVQAGKEVGIQTEPLHCNLKNGRAIYVIRS